MVVEAERTARITSVTTHQQAATSAPRLTFTLGPVVYRCGAVVRGAGAPDHAGSSAQLRPSMPLIRSSR